MYISALSTALPEHSIRQEQAAALAKSMCHYTDGQMRRIDKLYRLTRVERRHSVLLEDSRGDHQSQSLFQPSNGSATLGPPMSARMGRYEESAPRLAVSAARRALDHSGFRPDEITHLVTVSCSGFAAPGVDVALIKQLGLSPGTQRTHVGFMGCHGALNGMRVARGFVGSDPAARVLLVAVELCSIHYQYSDQDETNLANGLFSDGAAALIATADDTAQGNSWKATATGSCILPDSEDAMTWRVRDHGFQMTLGREVPALIKRDLRPWLSEWLAGHGLSVDDVGTWAVHPGGPAILLAVKDALALAPDALAASWNVLRDYGNMSSPTILFVLNQLRESRAPLPAVALGFGPGLAVETILFQ